MKGLCTDLLAFALQLRETSAKGPSDEGAVHISPGIYVTAEENPRKPQLRERLMKGLCTDLLAFALQLRETSAKRQSDEGAVNRSPGICLTAEGNLS